MANRRHFLSVLTAASWAAGCAKPSESPEPASDDLEQALSELNQAAGIGIAEDDLRKIDVPACVVPGHDDIHPQAVGERLSRTLPAAELHFEPERPPQGADVSRSERQRPLAEIFLAFLEKHGLS